MCRLCNGNGAPYIEGPCPMCSDCQDRVVWTRDLIIHGKKYKQFKQAPFILVLHRAVRKTDVASYMESTNRDVSYHYAYSGKYNDFVQMVPLTHSAAHCGKSRLLGLTGINRYSVGLCLPGPIDQPMTDLQKDQFKYLLDEIFEWVPSIKYVTTHQCIAIPRGRRTDPGEHACTVCISFHGRTLIRSLDEAVDEHGNMALNRGKMVFIP